MTTHRRGILIVEYDPSWPSVFEATKDRLEGLLGSCVVEIAHVGSTSIPGLCAKPKIDVDIVLESDGSIPEAIELLRQAGYAFHGNKYNDGMWAFTTGKGSYGERVYLCGPGNATHRKRVQFRDYLRSHPEEATAYGVLKKRLAAEANDDWAHYTGKKGPFVSYILQRAISEGV